MSDLREKVAEAIWGTTSAGKLFPWSESNESAREPWRRMADAAIAAHLVELGQGGCVMVKLTEPEVWDGPGRERYWRIGDTTVSVDRWGAPSIALDDNWADDTTPPTADELHEFAAAILAAADLVVEAEASR